MGSIQYCTHARGCRWHEWIRMTEDAGIVRSRPEKGRSPDNAACEGFFGRIGTEMFYGSDWSGSSLDEFMKAAGDCLAWFCNGKTTRATCPRWSIGKA